MQAHNPRIVTDGLICHLDPTNGGKEGSKILAKPTQISDCILWLDADDAETVVTSGANITNWLDKSGKGNHAEDHSGAKYPQYDSSRINGRRVVNFVATANATGDVLKGAFVSGSQPFSGTGTTMITVIRQNSFVGSEYASFFEAAQGAHLSGSYGNRVVFNIYGAAYGGGGSADTVRFAHASTGSEWDARIENGAAIIGVYTNDSSNTKAHINGEFIGSHSENKGSDARTYYCIGDDMTSGDAYNGYICEIIIYNKVLSDAERQSVEYYLSRKWAIPLKNRAVTNLANGDRVGELFPNGDFPSGLSNGETGYDNGDGTVDGWAMSPAGSPANALSVVSGVLLVNKNSSGYGYCNAYVSVYNLKAGSTYKASVAYDTKTASSVAFNVGTHVSVGTGTGTHTQTWVETGTSQPFYCYVYGTDAVYAELSSFSVVEVGGSPVETTNKNTFYFPNPDVDNCNLALEENEIAVADNLPWTIEFWIKRHARGNTGSGGGDGVHYDGVWGNSYTSSNYDRMQFGIGDEDKLWFGDSAGNGGEITNIADIDCLHKWRHVVLAFDGTTDPTTAGSLRQYVDGSDKGPAIALTTAPSNITVRRIGSRGHLTDDNRLEGELGNFRVYDKQLSHAEVLQNYNAQRAKYENKKMSFAAPDNLLVYWDAQSGTSSNYYANGTWYDISGGTAYNGTRSNATFTDEGVKYYALDGTGDYFEKTSAPSHPPYTSVGVWFRTTTSGAQYGPVSWGNASNAGGVGLSVNSSNQLYVSFRDDAWSTGLYPVITGTSTVTDGEWHYAVFTYDSAGAATLYIDGVAEVTSARGSAITNISSEILKVGLLANHPGTYFFTGDVALMQIHNIGLSADQVTQNYNYFKHRFGK